MKPQRAGQGFTLIELMIVVAIVAILAAIAYPSYREQVARSRRADAKAVLLETVQWIERQYTISSAYNLQSDGATAINSANLPPNYKQAPKTGSKNYDISFTAAPTALVFTLQAVPAGSMTGDKCGTFTLTQTGAKNVTGNTGGTSGPICWDR